MQDDTNSSANPNNPDQNKTGRRPARRWLFVCTVGLVAALTGAVASRAIGQHAFGPFFMGHPFDAASAEERADRIIRHVAIELDATNDQQEKLRAIIKDAVKDLLPVREKSLSVRQRAQVLLTQPTIDRVGMETLRAEQMALADAASKRVTQALGDAAEVLSSEQRRKLDARIHEMWERRGFQPGWHRG
jgi:periplasmic protein CpxP/Spy